MSQAKSRTTPNPSLRHEADGWRAHQLRRRASGKGKHAMPHGRYSSTKRTIHNGVVARPTAKPAPQTVRMQFPGSDQEYICAFVDGPSDIGMIAILNHDAAELDRIVAGLAAFRAQAAARAAAR
jgi:hypothetical protein